MQKNIILIILILLSKLTHAATIINTGSVSGVWTLAGSPYHIQGDINIVLWQVLVIEPGVEVIFDDYYTFTVDGVLSARGTASAPIQFKRDDTTSWHNELVPTGGWGGIRIDATNGVPTIDTGSMQYCIIQDVKHDAGYSSIYHFCALSLSQRNLQIGHCIFRHNISHHCIFEPVALPGNLNFSDCEFYNNRAYVAVIRSDNGLGYQNTFSNCKIHHNTSHLYSIMTLNNNLVFEDNEVYNNFCSTFSTLGCTNGQMEIRRNKFHHNTSGYATLASTAGIMTVEQNLFCNNESFDDFCGLSGAGGAIHLSWNSSKPYDSTSFLIRNNVFANNHSALLGSGIFINNCKAKVTNNHFVNNFADDLGGGGTIFTYGHLCNIDIRNNLFYGNVTDSLIYDLRFYQGDSIRLTNNWFDQVQHNAVDFNNWTGTIIDTTNNKIGIVPPLVNPTTSISLSDNATLKDFNITSGAVQCINQGINNNHIGSFDYLGATRIQGGVVDIGAFEIFNESPERINDISKINFSLLPNPANDFVQINFQDSHYRTIMLFNDMGRILDIKIDNGTSVTVPLRRYNSGTYLLKVIDGKNHGVKKLSIIK